MVDAFLILEAASGRKSSDAPVMFVSRREKRNRKARKPRPKR